MAQSRDRTRRISDRVDDLTCCRAFFAAWVFLYHVHLYVPDATGTFRPLLARGYLGVDGFFILSGMVLTLAHPSLPLRRGEVGRFWLKRLARLYPVHMAMLALFAVLLAAGHAIGWAPRDPGRFDTGELLRNLLLVHGWGVSDRWAWNYPSWSISTEWAGYLLFPLLWLGVRNVPQRLTGLLLIALLLLLLAANAVSPARGLNLTYDFALLRFFPEFVAGMAATRLGLLRMPGGALAFAGVALAGAGIATGPDAVVVAGLFMALFGILLADRQGSPPLLARIPGLIFLGTISYSFYMGFAAVEMVQSVLWRHWQAEPTADPLLFAASTTAFSLLLALALWRCVERPGMRLTALARGGRGG